MTAINVIEYILQSETIQMPTPKEYYDKMQDYLELINGDFNTAKKSKIFGKLFALVSLIGAIVAVGTISSMDFSIVSAAEKLIPAIFGTVGVLSGIGSVIGFVSSKECMARKSRHEAERREYDNDYQKKLELQKSIQPRLNELKKYISQNNLVGNALKISALSKNLKSDLEFDIVYNMFMKKDLPIDTVVYAISINGLAYLDEILLDYDATSLLNDKFSLDHKAMLEKTLDSMNQEAKEAMSENSKSQYSSVQADDGINQQLQLAQ